MVQAINEEINQEGIMVKVNSQTEQGGAVEFNKDHGAWASYGVHNGLLYAGVKLSDGRTVQLFVNRESGLVVADVIGKSGKAGREILRETV